MKHKHHIIPKHMGGSDDPSNLIELSVEEHSQAHLKLYEQYGKKKICVLTTCYLERAKIQSLRNLFAHWAELLLLKRENILERDGGLL